MTTYNITVDVLVKDVGNTVVNAALQTEMEGLLGPVTSAAQNGADFDYTWTALAIGMSFGRNAQKQGLSDTIEKLFAMVQQQAPVLDLDVTITNS